MDNKEKKQSSDSTQALLGALKNVDGLMKESSFRQAREELLDIYDKYRGVSGIDLFFFIFIIHLRIGNCEFRLGRLNDDSENYAHSLFNFEIANTFARDKKYQDLSIDNIIKITKFLFGYEKISSSLDKTYDLLDMILEHKNLYDLYTGHNQSNYEQKVMQDFIVKFSVLFISDQVGLFDTLYQILDDFKKGKNNILNEKEYENIKDILISNSIYRDNPNYLYK